MEGVVFIVISSKQKALSIGLRKKRNIYLKKNDFKEIEQKNKKIINNY